MPPHRKAVIRYAPLLSVSNTFKMIKWTGGLVFILFLSCSDTDSSKRKLISTKFIDDVKQYKLEQQISSLSNKHFMAIYYDETKSMSGVKILKLYNKDSFSIDEKFFGAHPLKISNWTDSIVWIDASVFSAHGDSLYRRIYLDGSVDKNKRIGKYKIEYNKNYNFGTK